jgi:glycine cleavage system transcriptional repressor
MSSFAISAIGRDRPGIVAAVTQVLLNHGVNIEDSQMTILRGHFTMMLVVAAPEGAEAGPLRSELEEAAGALGLEAISINPVPEADLDAEPDASHIVTVYGVDHPGIVHAVTSAMAERGVDITDLNTRLIGEAEEKPLYALMMEVALPSGVAPAELERDLQAVSVEQGVEVSLRELEQETL